MKGGMTTTVARAKEMRPIVEHYVSISKKGGIASFRRLLAKLPKASAEKLFYELAPKYKTRTGGYLRIIKSAKRRKRDAAEVARIEFV